MIDIGQLSYSSQGELLLDNVSVSVREGEVYALLCAEDASRNALCGLFRSALVPQFGSLSINGADLNLSALEARRCSLVITPRTSFYGSLTARQNVEFFARLGGALGVTSLAARQAMRDMGIPDAVFDHRLASLGAELAVLLWLAVAGLRKAKGIVIDDPSAGLSETVETELREALHELKGRGTALLLLTSNAAFACRIADRIGLLRHGRLLAERSAVDLQGHEFEGFIHGMAGR